MEYRYKDTVEAWQLTDEHFNKPHPNPVHIPGVIYSPGVHRCAFIKKPGGTQIVELGDYIVKPPCGGLQRLSPDVFENLFEPAE